METRQIGEWTVDMCSGERAPDAPPGGMQVNLTSVWVRIRRGGMATPWMGALGRSRLSVWKSLETLHLDALPMDLVALEETP